MLKSQELQRRQSEVREELAGLAANDTLTDEQRSKMTALDGEYRDNEAKYRAALITEDEQREQAGKALETREGKEWSELVNGYELRQAALMLDEGRALDGATAEVVQEMRNNGGYRGVPVPLEAFETRAGETVAANVPKPVDTKSIIDRLFPGSVAGAMGAQMVNIASGGVDYPIVTDGASVAWASSETGDVGGPDVFKTSPQSLRPDHNMGVQMRLTRKSLKQSAGVEQAIRRDMQAAIAAEMDRVVFQGSGTSGQPSGVIAKASSYGINEEAADPSSYGAFRSEIAAFIAANAAGGPGGVRILLNPTDWDTLDGAMFDAGSGITEYDKLAAKVGNVAISGNAIGAGKSLLTTSAGVAPIFVGVWGGVDLIRDPYSDAQSGGLRVTGIVTMDVTISRAAQLRVLTGAV